MWYPPIVTLTADMDIQELYKLFDPPITTLDCGARCAPHNEFGVPFCCDTKHAVPTAYAAEWAFLSSQTDLWHLWDPGDTVENNRLRKETPDDQVLIECLGHQNCQRNYRAITCRAFPFFPYVNQRGAFLGLAYYWQYEDRCWMISNLDRVEAVYRSAFYDAYQQLFFYFPEERENFRYHSAVLRRVFGMRKRAIPLLHRNGKAYKISPRKERLRQVDPATFPKHGVYAITAQMVFPDEK